MSNTTHTPGPWACIFNEYGLWVGTFDRHRVIADVKNERSMSIPNDFFPQPEEIHANARLIAAAPDLLEALETCAEALDFARAKMGICGPGDHKDHKADADDDIGCITALAKAISAISKAKGIARIIHDPVKSNIAQQQPEPEPSDGDLLLDQMHADAPSPYDP